MSLLDKILRKKKKKDEESSTKNFFVFLKEAEEEIDSLIKEHPQWFSELPYRAAMSKEEARSLEIEKRAVWRRVIYDAKRSKLPGLRWESSRDAKVCEECEMHEGKTFALHEYDQLNNIRMHIGCRCNLIPVR